MTRQPETPPQPNPSPADPAMRVLYGVSSQQPAEVRQAPPAPANASSWSTIASDADEEGEKNWRAHGPQDTFDPLDPLDSFDPFDPLEKDALDSDIDDVAAAPLAPRFALRVRYGQLILTAAVSEDLRDAQRRGFCNPQGILNASTMGKCLAWLATSGLVTLEHRPIAIGEPQSGLCVRVSESPRGILLRLEQDPRVTELFENGALRVQQHLHAIVRPTLGEKTFAALRRGQTFEGEPATSALPRVIARLREKVPVLWAIERPLPGLASEHPRLELQSQAGAGSLRLNADVVYGDPAFARVRDELCWLLPGEGLPARHREQERGLMRALEGWLGLPSGHEWEVRGLKAQELAKKLEESPPQAIFVDERATNTLQQAVNLQPRLAMAADGSVNLGFTVADETDHAEEQASARDRDGTPAAKASVSAQQLLQAFHEGHGFIELGDGRMARVPVEWIEEHLDLLLATLEQGRKRLDRWQKHALWDLRELLAALDRPPPIDLERLLDQELAFDPHRPVELPGDFHGELRSYQVDGVRWLHHLARAGYGGLLADDMGLGKTIQAICALQPASLIVAPTSLLPNWRAEIARFRPNLRVQVYAGPGRMIAPHTDITLTSYAILRQDVELLAARQWTILVLDEAQAIKNPESQAAQAVYRLPAKFRLALTGTPIENRLGDLWSLFHSLNPGLLGGRRSFLRRYDSPTARQQPASLQRLKRRIAPFLLRRTKDDVLPDLPAKTESVIYVELSPEERTIYNVIRAAMQAEIVENYAPNHNMLGALEALMRLRQAACHPGLLPGYPHLREQMSTKIDVLRQRLRELADEGHKALVFSQWSSMLDLIQPHLERANLRCLQLDGRTRDRAAVVQDFQGEQGSGGEADVLLATLKVGGVGLNLTAADYVFIVDPWWNGAAERQASDRAHRLGQTRPVFVQRLVAVQTIEERVLSLAQSKLALAQAVTGDHVTAALSRDELLALLE